jgi:alkanesulfonate monooxygenase SsuD/methylene tetrahydromethanopterin reductase-like flavin-dependent oxidoreductase (luciferase family)
VGSLASPDWAALGRRTEGQGARVDEALDIMVRLWRGETVDLNGRHFHYKGARVSPQPAQTPLPVWLGGSSPAAIRRTVRFGSGWQAGAESPSEVAPLVAAIKAAAIEAGRPMDPEHFGAGFFYRFGAGDDPVVEARRAAFRRTYPSLDPDRAIVVGGSAEIVQRVRDYEAAGISKFILRPLGRGDDDLFDQTERLIAEVIPAIHGSKAES